jgi:hypothetical protein
MFKKIVFVLSFTMLLSTAGHAGPYSRQLSGDTQLTQIKIFTPWHRSGDTIHHSIKSIKRMNGVCTNASLVNPRPDAWRCKAENVIHDPCFANESGQQVACINSPWDKTAVLITLSQRLPSEQGNSENYLEQNPWGVELDNTLRCVASDSGSSSTLAGMTTNSICFNQASNVTPVKFLDSFNQELPTWLVFIKQEDLYLEQVPIKTAWY